MSARAITGTYADFKIVKTRNVAQFIIEVPLESADEAITMFGLPDPHVEKWVAVALLQTNLITKSERSTQAVQSAGILCGDKRFGEYLKSELRVPEVNPEIPDSIANGLRALLGIKSRTEFHTNSEAVDAFYRIKGEYDLWVIQ